MKKINKWLECHITHIILTFLFLQPVIDVLTGISNHYLSISFNISSILRLFFFFFCIYYLVILDHQKAKKKNILYLLIYFIYFMFYFISVLISKGSDVVVYEIQNNLNIFYFPIVFIGLNSILKQYHVSISLKHIVYLFCIYLIFVMIPNIFHLGFSSYEHSKVGSIGWFLSANTIGSILSILLPLVLIYVFQQKGSKIFKILIIICSIFVFFSIGTKVPVLSALVLILMNILYFVIHWIQEKKYKNICAILCALVVLVGATFFLLPKTSFYKNIIIHKEFLGIQNYTEIFTQYERIDHFIFSQRLTFLKNTSRNYQKSNWYQKLLGIGFIENYGTDQVSMKTIEMDYFEIFYRSGFIGCIIYFIIFVPSLCYCFKKIKNFNLLNIEYFTILLLILLLSLFQGHILVTPSVSIYVALIMSLILNKSLKLEY